MTTRTRKPKATEPPAPVTEAAVEPEVVEAVSPAVEFLDELPVTARKGGGRKTDKVLVEFADLLKSNPGKWAKYPKDLSKKSAGTAASTINNRKAASFRDGKYEAATRDGVVYVKYVGPNDSEE